jgi:hypothetical protein
MRPERRRVFAPGTNKDNNNTTNTTTAALSHDTLSEPGGRRWCIFVQFGTQGSREAIIMGEQRHHLPLPTAT